MSGTSILTAAAFIAILPAGALLFFVLDRYTVPRVPESAFEEFKVLVAFIVGIPAGLPLALLFLIYAGDLQSLQLFSALLWMLVFVVVANLERLVFLRFKTFSGREGRSRKAYFYTLGFGAGNAVCILLGAANYSLGIEASVVSVLLLSLLSVDIALLEGWGGLRFAAAHRAHLGLYRVPLVEALGLLAISPLYLGISYANIVSLVILAAVMAFLLVRDEQRFLRPLLKPKASSEEPKPFGRSDSSESSES